VKADLIVEFKFFPGAVCREGRAVALFDDKGHPTPARRPEIAAALLAEDREWPDTGVGQLSRHSRRGGHGRSAKLADVDGDAVRA